MARDFPLPKFIDRDGTSQAGRQQAALDPAYVAIDERSPEDLLRFAKEYGKSLAFVNERDESVGDWGGFLDVDTDSLAQLSREPSGVPEDEPGNLAPHRALFLTFLRLLRHPRDLINSLTDRHLDYYYAQVLRMSRKAALPDRVHVLAKPARGIQQARLPAGTMLLAGKDSSGRDRKYRTDREVVVNQARLVRLCSVYVQKEITSIRDARERRATTRDESLFLMWKIALGHPHPGDDLPKFDKSIVDYSYLKSLHELVGFAEKRLFMDFSDLQSLVQIKKRLDAADSDWAEINGILEKAGQQRLKDPSWKLAPTEARDFFGNLKKALGASLDFERDGLPQVASLDDLYVHMSEDDCRKFIADKIFLDVATFAKMMAVKTRIDNGWREINRIIESAGRRRQKDPLFKIEPWESPAFDTNLKSALGDIDYSKLLIRCANLLEYQDIIRKIEDYVHMNAAQFDYVMKVAQKESATNDEWDTAYAVLAEAHKEKVYAGRRQTLRELQENSSDRKTGFAAILLAALGGEAAAGVTARLEALRQYVQAASDFAFLTAVASRLVTDEKSISKEEWTRTYQVVELAQRVREQLPEPAAIRERWLNVSCAGDARSVVGDKPAQPTTGPSRWKTFGQQRPATDKNASPAELVGWALSSPMLQLASGTRTIVLTLGFRSSEFDQDRLKRVLGNNPIKFEVSTEKGWKVVSPPTFLVDDYAKLTQLSRKFDVPLSGVQFTLTLGADQPPLTPMTDEVGQIANGWPMIRLMLAQSWDAERQQFVLPYETFRDLFLAAVHLKTDVKGLIPAAIQNDDGALSAQKPFEPFGTSPAVGSHFFIGDPELVVKPLDSLTFHLNWRGVPSDLKSHYTNYGDAAVGPWMTKISLVDDRVPLLLANSSLFDSTDATKQWDITVSDLARTLEKKRPRTELPPSKPVSSWPRHVLWELTPTDFKHQVYPAVATKKALELAAAIAKSPATADASKYQVNPPYTPKLQSLLVDYVASTEIVLTDVSLPTQSARLFHVHPFGQGAMPAEGTDGARRFLPRYENEGELYLGFDNIVPPQNLSLLFQMEEGSADPDLERTPIRWDLLSGDDWMSLHDGGVLFDSTRGLTGSGIVEFALKPTEPSTRLPSGLTWIRTSLARNVGSVCDTISIHPHAVSATFVDDGNAIDHYGRGLPERSITKLRDRLPQIASVEQPFASTGARPAESSRTFHTRVSERLRHKQRALTLWDYERLVLEQFPSIFKAKCIPWNPAQGTDAIGTVKLVVIPNVRGLSSANPFAPKVPANLLSEVQSFLADKCPPQAAIQVCNAHYVPVKVRMGVRFLPGLDEGFYKIQLNEDLCRFLSPWAFGDGSDIATSGKIFANSIVNFIDSRDYVDYVATIKLFSSEDDGLSFQVAKSDASMGLCVSTTRPDGVLVSAPQHEIDLISNAGYDTKNFSGINYMKIELDFVVGGST